MPDIPCATERKRILVLCGNDSPGISAANVYVSRLREHDVRVMEERVLTVRRAWTFSRRRLRSKGLLSLLDSYAFCALHLCCPASHPKRLYKPEHVSSGFSRDGALAEYIRQFKPDIVLTAFCGLLDEDFLSLLPEERYNLHPGINPRYRGFGNIWALRENNTACLGYTIHKIDKGIDTGERIAAGLVEASALATVPLSDIDLPVMQRGAEHLSAMLLGERMPEIPPACEDLPSALYGVPGLSTLWAARRNLRKAVKTPGHVLITGASSGIGKALALEYAAPGKHLSLWARNGERLREVAALCREKGAEVSIVKQDIRDLEQSRAVLAALDKEHAIDLAILGAGVSSGTLPGGGLEPAEDACRTMQINATASVNLAGSLVPLMRERGHGCLLCISSIAALYPLPDSPAYSAAKIALAYYAKGLRPHAGKIRLCIAYPGYVDSPMSRRFIGPQPMRWPAEKAAKYIRRKLEKGATSICFPLPLALGALLLHLLPDPVALFFLRSFGFHIEPDVKDGWEKAGTDSRNA